MHSLLMKEAWTQLVDEEKSQDRGSGRRDAILADLAPAALTAGWPHTGPLALPVQEQKSCPAELSLPTDFWEMTNCCFKPLGLLQNNKLLKHYSSGIYRQNKYLSFPTCNSKSWSYFLILRYFITASCLIWFIASTLSSQNHTENTYITSWPMRTICVWVFTWGLPDLSEEIPGLERSSPCDFSTLW